MNVFEEVKAHISASTVIADYGVKIGRNGIACCPFHDDRHPSMKVDDTHYHCFGCGAHGDVINFVAHMEGISNYDAAVKIIEDYRLPIEITHEISDKEREEFLRRKAKESQIISIKKQFNKWVDDKIHELKECEKLIAEAREFFFRESPGMVFISNGFVYLLHKETIVGYWLEILCMGDEADKCSLFLEEREEVSRIAANIKRAGREILGNGWKCAG